jgi:hypothetical protein
MPVEAGNPRKASRRPSEPEVVLHVGGMSGVIPLSRLWPDLVGWDCCYSREVVEHSRGFAAHDARVPSACSEGEPGSAV